MEKDLQVKEKTKQIKKPEWTNTVDGEIENCGDKDRPGGAAQHRQGLVVIEVFMVMIEVFMVMITVPILIAILMRVAKNV